MFEGFVRQRGSYPPQKSTCPLKRDHLKRTCHLPTINFSGDIWGFRGISACHNDRKTLHKTAEIYGAPDAVGHTLRCGARLSGENLDQNGNLKVQWHLNLENARVILDMGLIETIIEFLRYMILHKKSMYVRRGRQKHHEFASLLISIDILQQTLENLFKLQDSNLVYLYIHQTTPSCR